MRHLIAIDESRQPYVVASFEGFGLDGPRREELGRLALEFVELMGGDTLAAASGQHELGMRVGRGPVYVRLGKVSTEEITRFVLFAALVLGGSGDAKVLTAAGLAALHDRVTKLSAKWGERTIADTVIELGEATIAAIAQATAGKPCRHTEAKCAFMELDRCTLAESQIEPIVAALLTRGVVKRLNAFEPAVYGPAV
jgi:hypothetical protein